MKTGSADSSVELIISGRAHFFIDDEEILAEMGRIMLERLGYRVIAAAALKLLPFFGSWYMQQFIIGRVIGYENWPYFITHEARWGGDLRGRTELLRAPAAATPWAPMPARQRPAKFLAAWKLHER
jgi:hypothetical protein